MKFPVYIYLLFFYSVKAQNVANKKCDEYQKIRGTLSKIGLGIIGGSLSHNSEFPHMVALGYYRLRRDTTRKWLCGGTIVSQNFVLTAAHCTTHQEYGPVKIVRMGVTNVKDNNAIDSDVSRIIVHPNYRPPLLYNDIALLKLKNAIVFSKLVLPACLNTAFDIRPRTSKLTATGWGVLTFGGSSSDNLMKVELNSINNRECQDKYSSVCKRKLSRGIDDRSQMCAGARSEEEKDTCQGDSGGPLVIKTGTLYTVVGVTAFGRACGIGMVPGVYTRVSHYVPWIEKIIWHQ